MRNLALALSNNGTNSTSNSSIQRNILGKAKENSLVANSPYQIESCDQVVKSNCSYLLDYEDYRNKNKSAFFTMNAYMINLFETKNSTRLLKHISLDEIKESPKILQGSVSCIDFKYTKRSKIRNIGICLDNEEHSLNLIKAFNSFFRCRMGDNLHENPQVVFDKMIKKSCLGMKISLNSSTFNDTVKDHILIDNAINKALRSIADKLK